MTMATEHEVLCVELGQLDELSVFVSGQLMISARPVSEYDLLQQCLAAKLLQFDGLAYERQLFCRHFLLFHALYNLRDQWLDLAEADVTISALAIGRVTLERRPKALGQPDGLRAYYLNLENYFGTDAAEVRRLLNGFWSAFAGGHKRDDALRTLQLRDPVSREQIRSAYRKLAMRHHPDRGGDTEQFQTLQAAACYLLRTI